MEANQFRCAHCGGVFEKDWTDEEAHAEREQLWPGFTEAECDVICDECFEQFMGWADKRGLVKTPKEEGLRRLESGDGQ